MDITMREAADPVGQDPFDEDSEPDAVNGRSEPDAVDDRSEPDAVDDRSESNTIDDRPEPDAVDDRPDPDAIGERLEYYEEMTVWRVPVIDWPISVNKVHAVVYGFVGYYVGALSVHEPVVSLTLAIALNLGAMGIWIVDVSRIERIGIETIKYKPHYFVVPFLLTFLIGRYAL